MRPNESPELNSVFIATRHGFRRPTSIFRLHSIITRTSPALTVAPGSTRTSETVPAFGDFMSAQLLGGPRTYMIGNLVQQQFLEGQNWPLGSAMTVAMMAALTVLMVVYLRASSTRSQEPR